MDHTDFIRIRGLVDSDTEVFQGLGAALAIQGGEESGGGTQLEWGTIPEEAVQMVSDYTESLQDWISEAVQYDPESGSRSLAPELLDNLPTIPLAIGTVAATGGAALPAVATVMLSQVIMNLVGSSIANYAASLDENSPVNILKKAFLYDNDGSPESILKTALLRLTDTEKSILQARLLKIQEGVEDLTFIDGALKYADNTGLHVKGKVLRR